MPLSVRFLGTAAARPTVERGVTSLAVSREGETFLVDCGEGTQRQMMRYGVSFALGEIFFTHLHSDHVLGLPGLLRTLGLQGRTDPLQLWTPKGTGKVLRQYITVGGERPTYPVNVTEVVPGSSIQRRDYRIDAIPVDHRGTIAVAWALVEHDRLGRFNPERARELGVPEGPLWGRLHRGETVTLPDGRTVGPAELVGTPRRGRTVVISGDTRPCAAVVQAAWRADLLVHEATFGDEEAERARETGHTTAREAAEVARMADVRRLVLTHFSARYSRDPGELEREARTVFPRARAAKDGYEVTIPYDDEIDEPPVPAAEGAAPAPASAARPSPAATPAD
jgi:ribonuclease Z